MLSKEAYTKFLAGKKTNPKIMGINLALFDEFEKFLAKRGITDLADVDFNRLDDFNQPVHHHYRPGQPGLIDSFLHTLAVSVEGELPNFSKVIRAYYANRYEVAAKKCVSTIKKNIKPIADDCKIDPKHLGELSNRQFVSAFKELQNLAVRIYDDIEKSPFEWGYPDFDTTDGYYNRVNDVLFAFVLNGTLGNGAITVDTKKFLAAGNVKRHKKVELMITGFNRMGLTVEGFYKKSEYFKVSYPSNPHVTAVLIAYVKQVEVAPLYFFERLSAFSPFYLAEGVKMTPDDPKYTNKVQTKKNPKPEDIFNELLTGENLANALDFIAWLREIKHSPQWNSSNQWRVDFNDCNCFIYVDRKDAYNAKDMHPWGIRIKHLEKSYSANNNKYSDKMKGIVRNNILRCNGLSKGGGTCHTCIGNRDMYVDGKVMPFYGYEMVICGEKMKSICLGMGVVIDNPHAETLTAIKEILLINRDWVENAEV